MTSSLSRLPSCQFAEEGDGRRVRRAGRYSVRSAQLPRFADGFFHVFGGAVLGVKFYGVTVGYDVATESPFRHLERVGEPMVATCAGMPS